MDSQKQNVTLRNSRPAYRFFGARKREIKAFYLRRYIRDERRNPIGVMVATPEGVGWSVKAPRDQFNRRLGIHIAEQRLQTGTNARIPDYAEPQLEAFKKSAHSYFYG